MIVQKVTREDTTLTLWQIEARKLFFHSFLVCVGIINVKDAPCESGTHLSAVVSVHSKWPSLAESLVSAREFTETSSCKDRRISGLEVLVNDKSSIINESIVMNSKEHILVDVSVSSCDQDTTINLFFVLLSPLFLLYKVSLLIITIFTLTSVFVSASISATSLSRALTIRLLLKLFNVIIVFLINDNIEHIKDYRL